MTGLDGARILVVGGSSGIGRALGRSAAARGARIALAARRGPRLEEAVAEAGGGLALRADVRRPEDCARLVEAATAELGGLDVLFYAAGVTPLAWLAAAGAGHWREVFETNLFGAALVTRAALPHLSGGLAVYVSSDSVGRPRQGLAAYSASKAALDEMLRGWRLEHPELRFLRLVLGPTLGTDVARDYDAAAAGDLLRRWVAHGFMTERHLQAAELGELLADVLATCLAHPDVAVEDLRLEPPGPPLLDEQGR